ncbi:MAG: Rho termination factor N-terminal domain-containing protein [Actinomycetales bacterium]
MPRNITATVRTDHHRLERLTGRLFVGRTTFVSARDDLVQSLGAHLEAEELVVHRAAATKGAPSELLVSAGEIAEELRQALSELATVPERHQGGDLDTRLLGLLKSHIEVEDEIGETLAGGLPEAMRRLGGDYGRAREAAAARLRRTTVVPRRLDRPRTELYEMARRVGIEGRTRMSREQLIQALLDHEALKVAR